MATTVREPTPSELTRIERHEAWLEYLAEIKGLEQARYGEVEPWAWERLLAKLDRLKARRAAA